MKEAWRQIKGFEGRYSVSSFGRVKSEARYVNGKHGKRLVKEKILSMSVGGAGYLTVNLSKDSKISTKNVHVLVAIAFHNHKPDSYSVVVDHDDGDKLNNRAYNLVLKSHRSNITKGYVTKSKSSKYTGASWNKHTKKYQSRINLLGTDLSLGMYVTALGASEVYQKALSRFLVDEEHYKEEIHILPNKYKREYLLK